METVSAPGLAPDDSQAIYDTVLDDQPAIIKYFRIENNRAGADLLSSLEAAQHLHHPNLIRILQSGETSLGEETVAYAIMEKADDNLASVLRHRPLDADDTRELLDGMLPALEFLHAKGYAHSRIRPANVLACGNTVKLSSDRIRSLSLPRSIVEPPGLYDAPETGAGRFSPASDVYSLARLILEALTGAPVESGIEELPQPFREIVKSGLRRDPAARWTLHKIRETLHPEAAHSTPFASAPPYDEPGERPKYRKLGVIAIAGALVAGSVCALLVRSAHQAPQPPATPAPMVRTAARPAPPPAKPAMAENATAVRGRWVVVGAAYRRQADAEKRAESIRHTHPSLNAGVYPTSPGARRYLVLFGEAESRADAKREARRVRSEGAPRGVYVTHLE
jgi:eukaryotic-like serine/threonine-protein kinase